MCNFPAAGVFRKPVSIWCDTHLPQTVNRLVTVACGMLLHSSSLASPSRTLRPAKRSPTWLRARCLLSALHGETWDLSLKRTPDAIQSEPLPTQSSSLVKTNSCSSCWTVLGVKMLDVEGPGLLWLHVVHCQAGSMFC